MRDEEVGQDHQSNPESKRTQKSAPPEFLATDVAADHGTNDSSGGTENSEQENKPPPPVRTWVVLHWEKLKHVGLHEWVMIAATVAMAASTITYTVYSRKQLGVMQGTLEEMKTSGQTASSQTSDIIHEAQIMSDEMIVSNRQNAEAVKETLARSKEAMETSERQSQAVRAAGGEALRLDQRAWISLGFIGANPQTLHVGDRPFINVSLKNTGKTPARHLSTFVLMERVDRGDMPNFAYDRDRVVQYGVLSPNADAFTTLNLTPNPVTRENSPLPIQLLNSLIARDAVVFVHGEVSYDDIFASLHWLTFCYAMVNLPGPVTFSSCPWHNDTGDGQPPK